MSKKIIAGSVTVALLVTTGGTDWSRAFAAGDRQIDGLERVFSRLPGITHGFSDEQREVTQGIVLMEEPWLGDADYRIAANFMAPYLIEGPEAKYNSPEELENALNWPATSAAFKAAIEALRNAQEQAKPAIRTHSIESAKAVKNGGTIYSLAYHHPLDLSQPDGFRVFFSELVSARRLFGSEAIKPAVTEAYNAIRAKAELKEELRRSGFLPKDLDADSVVSIENRSQRPGSLGLLPSTRVASKGAALDKDGRAESLSAFAADESLSLEMRRAAVKELEKIGADQAVTALDKLGNQEPGFVVDSLIENHDDDPRTIAILLKFVERGKADGKSGPFRHSLQFLLEKGEATSLKRIAELLENEFKSGKPSDQNAKTARIHYSLTKRLATQDEKSTPQVLKSIQTIIDQIEDPQIRGKLSAVGSTDRTRSKVRKDHDSSQEFTARESISLSQWVFRMLFREAAEGEADKEVFGVKFKTTDGRTYISTLAGTVLVGPIAVLFGTLAAGLGVLLAIKAIVKSIFMGGLRGLSRVKAPRVEAASSAQNNKPLN